MKTPRPVTELHPAVRPRVGDWVRVRSTLDYDGELPGACRVVGYDPADGMFQSDAYCVEFIEKDPQFHDGSMDCSAPLGKDKHCWWASCSEIEPLPMDLCIFHEGDKTYCLRGDKRRVSGTATFARTEEAAAKDDLVGAVIAMARAYDRSPTEVAWSVLKAMSHQPRASSIINDTEPVSAETKQRVKVLENNYDELWEKIDHLEDWLKAVTDEQDAISDKVEALRAQMMYKKPEKKAKVKRLYYLIDGQDSYGVIGTPTKYKTTDGQPLKVGDWVRVTGNSGLVDHVMVVETETDGAFIMGCCGYCEPLTGTISKALTKVELAGWPQPKVGKTFHMGIANLPFVIKEEEV